MIVARITPKNVIFELALVLLSLLALGGRASTANFVERLDFNSELLEHIISLEESGCSAFVDDEKNFFVEINNLDLIVRSFGKSTRNGLLVVSCPSSEQVIVLRFSVEGRLRIGERTDFIARQRNSFAQLSMLASGYATNGETTTRGVGFELVDRSMRSLELGVASSQWWSELSHRIRHRLDADHRQDWGAAGLSFQQESASEGELSTLGVRGQWHGFSIFGENKTETNTQRKGHFFLVSTPESLRMNYAQQRELNGGENHRLWRTFFADWGGFRNRFNLVSIWNTTASKEFNHQLELEEAIAYFLSPQTMSEFFFGGICNRKDSLSCLMNNMGFSAFHDRGFLQVEARYELLPHRLRVSYRHDLNDVLGYDLTYNRGFGGSPLSNLSPYTADISAEGNMMLARIRGRKSLKGWMLMSDATSSLLASSPLETTVLGASLSKITPHSEIELNASVSPFQEDRHANVQLRLLRDLEYNMRILTAGVMWDYEVKGKAIRSLSKRPFSGRDIVLRMPDGKNHLTTTDELGLFSFVIPPVDGQVVLNTATPIGESAVELALRKEDTPGKVTFSIEDEFAVSVRFFLDTDGDGLLDPLKDERLQIRNFDPILNEAIVKIPNAFYQADEMIVDHGQVYEAEINLPLLPFQFVVVNVFNKKIDTRFAAGKQEKIDVLLRRR
jgi:hypothetical protein